MLRLSGSKVAQIFKGGGGGGGGGVKGDILPSSVYFPFFVFLFCPISMLHYFIIFFLPT